MGFIEKVKRLGLITTLDDYSGNLFSQFKYEICKIRNKPYFGSYMAATQGKSIRHGYMTELVRYYCDNLQEKRPIKILEIGSWAGGSAITWTNALRQFSQPDSKLYCVDAWELYFDTSKDCHWTHKTMSKALVDNKIFGLFMHNMIASRNQDMVSVLKGKSQDILSLFGANKFDIIFIDADHSYTGCRNDIIACAPLLVEGGVLCGDDLELQINEIDVANAESIKEGDVAVDPKTGNRFHPGVTLAVGEFFNKKVSSDEGFWYMEKTESGWQNINLNIEIKPVVPSHLL